MDKMAKAATGKAPPRLANVIRERENRPLCVDILHLALCTFNPV